MPTPSSPSDERCAGCGHLQGYHTTDACYGGLEEWNSRTCACPGYQRLPFSPEQEQRIISLIDERIRLQHELSSR